MIEVAALQGAGAAGVGPGGVAAPAPAASTPHRSAFHQLLSELNPLQYLPVVGTIYRAITGDTIPEAARIAGSFVVSGLMGGPVGLAINVGTTLLEKATGIDPERIAQRMFASVGTWGVHGDAPRAAAKVAPSPAKSGPWTDGQLAAYGVRQTEAGDMKLGEAVGADVLNGLELQRLHMVA